MLTLWELTNWIGILVLSFLFFIQVVLRFIKHYIHVPIPAFATPLIDNPLRRRFIQKPETIADRMHIEPGMTVLEIGPGKGSYTIAVAKRVQPGGKVYAVDIQEAVIRKLEQRLRREKVDNVIPRVDDAYDLGFPDRSIDRVFAVACLPEIPEPVRALKEFHRVLKDNGLVSFSELLPDPDYPRRVTMINWAEKAGFTVSASHGNFFVYQLSFIKKGTELI